MLFNRNWEDITDDKHAGCSRLKVFGGWLIVAWASPSTTENLIFLSDPNHEWELEPLDTKKS